MNGKSWTANGVWDKINNGKDTEWFIKEYDMKDKNELIFQLGRFYKYNRDECVRKILKEMEANKSSKENKSRRKKSKTDVTEKINANIMKSTTFVPVKNGGMTVPYNLNTRSLTSGLKVTLNKNNLESSESLSSKHSNTLENNIQVNETVVLPELQQLRNQLNSNEEYISELQCKLDETYNKFNEERKWFTDIVNYIKNLVTELNDAKKLLPEKMASMNVLVEKINETEQLLDLAKTESTNLRDKISDLTAKKVYFGTNKTEMNFDFLGANYTIEEEKIISKITYFLTSPDISGLIGEYSIDEIKRLARIVSIVDIIKQEHKEYSLEIYFDESNDLTELVGLVTSSKVKTV